MKLKVRKLSPDAQLPKRAHATDVGFDVFATKIEHLGNKVKVFTGISIQPEPGYYVELFSRSSVHKHGLVLANSVGIIDPGYTGELIFIFFKQGEGAGESLQIGERIGQLIVRKQIAVELQEVDVLLETDRGEGGYGSTGVF